MNKQSWQTKKRIESDYSSSMMKMANYFFSKAVEGMDSYDEQLEVLRSASSKPTFMEWANTVARRMITGLYASSASTWREAASIGTEGKQIHKMLSNELEGVTGHKVQELVRNNADLISSLPLEVSKKVTALVQKLAAKGMRYEAISKLLVEKKLVKKLTKQRITLIARTETSKASTALTRARAEDLDLDWYVWRTSKDGRVRNSHKHMEGVLVSWSEAPAPELLAGVKSKLGHYHAGDAPNDRCYPQPVLSLSSLQWPMKVYYAGQIQYMTRSKFEKIAGIEMRKAA
jgi:SPP1 gp7 family putative phage head morphogenesis protein